MSNYGFEYNLFSLGNEEVSEDTLSEMVISLCMQDDIGDPEHFEDMLRHLINALDCFRRNQNAMADSDDQKPINLVEKPEDLFMELYEKFCDKAGIAVCDGDAWWEDHWPLKACWHRKEIVRLVCLQIGKVEVHRRAICEWMKARKEEPVGGEK